VTFDELKTELYARGFSYLNEDAAGQLRAARWINQGYQDLLEEADWPFATATVTDAPPVTITDLRDVLAVTGRNGALEQSTLADLDDAFDLTQTGTAAWWYQDGTQIKTYPVDGSSLTIAYLKIPADLSASGDVPIVPARYHQLIVDFAVIRALRDRSNFAEADALWQALQVDLARMRSALLGQDPMFQRLTDCQSA
jgi:hypothetical protein